MCLLLVVHLGALRTHPFEYEQRAFHFLLGTEQWRRESLPLFDPNRTQGFLKHITFLPQVSLRAYFLFRVIDRRHSWGNFLSYLFFDIATYIILLPLHMLLCLQCAMNSYTLLPKGQDRWKSEVGEFVVCFTRIALNWCTLYT